MTEQRGQTLAAGLLAAGDEDEDEEDGHDTPVAAPAPAATNQADRMPATDKQPGARKGGEQKKEAETPLELASIEQILAWVRGGRTARPDSPSAAEAPVRPGADSKRAETDRRAANSDG